MGVLYFIGREWSGSGARRLHSQVLGYTGSRKRGCRSWFTLSLDQLSLSLSYSGNFLLCSHWLSLRWAKSMFGWVCLYVPKIHLGTLAALLSPAAVTMSSELLVIPGMCHVCMHQCAIWEQHIDTRDSDRNAMIWAGAHNDKLLRTCLSILSAAEYLFKVNLFKHSAAVRLLLFSTSYDWHLAGHLLEAYLRSFFNFLSWPYRKWIQRNE